MITQEILKEVMYYDQETGASQQEAYKPKPKPKFEYGVKR